MPLGLRLSVLPLGLRLSVLPLVGALPLLAAIWLSAEREAAELHEQAGAGALEAATIAARAQDEAVAQVGAFLVTVAELAPVQRFDPNRCDTALAAAIEGQRLVQTLVALDPDGFIRCHSEGWRQPQSQLRRPDIAAAIAQTGPFLRQPSISSRTGLPTAGLVQAVRDPDGQLRSIVSATFDPGRLPAMAVGRGRGAKLGQVGQPSPRSLLVIDQLGRTLKRLPDGAAPLRPASIDSLLSAPSGIRVVHDTAGQASILGFARSETLDVIFGVAEPLAPIELHAMQHRNAALRMGALVLALGLVSALLLGHLLVRRPVRRMIEAARAIARGDYGAPSRMGRLPGELEQAREALCQMAETLDLREADAQADRDILASEANSDPLTGLPNRRAFNRALSNCFGSAQATGEQLAVLMIDVDHFKAYNDGLGHPAGDECLRRLAQVMQGSLRSGDLVARLGGEEFAVLMPHATAEGAVQVANRLRLALAELALPHPRSPHRQVTVSVGIAAGATDRFGSAERLMAVADHGVYAAKHAGRDRWVVAEPDSQGPIVSAA